MQVIKENGVEVIPEPKPTNYWMRNKKPMLNFLHDTPFAAERQLEDQKFLSELNRNPRLNDFTKMDKLRSVQIAQAKGQSRSVAIKANVINKVVREASGVHNYTIVPPPRISDDKSVIGTEKLEPETNPLVRAYAQEAKLKPVMCSFGHRPRSASRTFHPATMKFRLNHGQILPSVKDGKTGVGLPVSVLKKVLHAPKLHHDIGDMIENDEDENSKDVFSPNKNEKRMHHTSSAPGFMEGNSNLRNDLFLSKDEQDELFAPNRHRKGSKNRLMPLDSESKGSWISSIEQRQRQKKQLPKSDKPEWNEGFHRISMKAKDLFELKKSLLNPKSDKPLSELLHRFDSRTVAENQPPIFCPEKQELDKIQRSGQSISAPKSVPVKGRPLYSDPWDIQMQQVKVLRKLEQEDKQEKIAAKEFQEKLRTIPKVNYYPTTVLKQMQAQQESFSHSNTENVPSSSPTSPDKDTEEGLRATSKKTATKMASTSNTMETLEEKYPHWAHTEDEMHLALLLAKRGDRRALYDFHLGGANRDSTSRALPSAWRNDHTASSNLNDSTNGLSDFPEWNQSAVSALSDSQAQSGSYAYPHQEIDETEDESTQVGRPRVHYQTHNEELDENSTEDGNEDTATVPLTNFEHQRHQLAHDLEQQALLDENTIE